METVQLQRQGIGQEFNGYCCLYFVRVYYHVVLHCWCLQVDKKTCGCWDGVVLDAQCLSPHSKYIKTFPSLHNKTYIEQVNEFLINEFRFAIETPLPLEEIAI